MTPPDTRGRREVQRLLQEGWWRSGCGGLPGRRGDGT